MESLFAQNTTTDPCYLLRRHTPLLGIRRYTKHSNPTPNTPFHGLNLKVCKMNYRLGNLESTWAKCLKSGQNISRSGQFLFIHYGGDPSHKSWSSGRRPHSPAAVGRGTGWRRKVVVQRRHWGEGRRWKRCEPAAAGGGSLAAGEGGPTAAPGGGGSAAARGGGAAMAGPAPPGGSTGDAAPDHVGGRPSDQWGHAGGRLSDHVGGRPSPSRAPGA